MAVGERLELDRGLALVGDRVAEAAERGDGVEQAAHARRRRRGEAGAGELGDLLPLRRGTSRPISSSHAQAIRHGSRIAASPPGIRTGHSWPIRSKPAQVAAQQLAAPDRAVGAVAGAVVDRARRRLDAVLGEARREVGVVVLDGDAPAGRGRARTWSTGTPGAGRARRARA